MCVRESEHAPMPGDPWTACGEWFFPPTIWGSDQTQVIRFGGNCLYPVNHLTDPKIFHVCLFSVPGCWCMCTPCVH